MDRRQGQAGFLIAAALLLLSGASTPRELPIRDSRWLQSPDIVTDLTRQPAECLAWPAEEKRRKSVEMGRALFRSPLLLGGQAARAGLSCSSCHRNGRTNPHFHFPGISGDPGTADVTASLMSEKRGDGIFNPKPIPDLAGDPSKLKVSRDPAKDDLRHFIHGLIVEEFSGREPSPAALTAVADYVRALSPKACPTAASTGIRLGDMLSLVDSAVELAKEADEAGDPATARALLAAARSTLGSIDERYQTPGASSARRDLRKASEELFRLQEAATAPSWMAWKRSWPARERAIRALERRSLFNAAVLKRQLAS